LEPRNRRGEEHGEAREIERARLGAPYRLNSSLNPTKERRVVFVRAQAFAVTEPFVVVTAVREPSCPLSRSFDLQAIVSERRVSPVEHRKRADHLASIMRGLPPLTCVLYSKQFPRFVRVAINPYFERQG
jgi:hypothetical protein